MSSLRRSARQSTRATSSRPGPAEQPAANPPLSERSANIQSGTSDDDEPARKRLHLQDQDQEENAQWDSDLVTEADTPSAHSAVIRTSNRPGRSGHGLRYPTRTVAATPLQFSRGDSFDEISPTGPIPDHAMRAPPELTLWNQHQIDASRGVVAAATPVRQSGAAQQPTPVTRAAPAIAELTKSSQDASSDEESIDDDDGGVRLDQVDPVAVVDDDEDDDDEDEDGEVAPPSVAPTVIAPPVAAAATPAGPARRRGATQQPTPATATTASTADTALRRNPTRSARANAIVEEPIEEPSPLAAPVQSKGKQRAINGGDNKVVETDSVESDDDDGEYDADSGTVLDDDEVRVEYLEGECINDDDAEEHIHLLNSASQVLDTGVLNSPTTESANDTQRCENFVKHSLELIRERKRQAGETGCLVMTQSVRVWWNTQSEDQILEKLLQAVDKNRQALLSRHQLNEQVMRDLPAGTTNEMRGFAVYIMYAVAPNGDAQVYVGSGTSMKYGVQSRISQYEYYLQRAKADKGYLAATKSVPRHIREVANQKVFLRIVATLPRVQSNYFDAIMIEGIFTDMFRGLTVGHWHATFCNEDVQKASYDACPVERRLVLYSGLNHASQFLQVSGGLKRMYHKKQAGKCLVCLTFRPSDPAKLNVQRTRVYKLGCMEGMVCTKCHERLSWWNHESPNNNLEKMTMNELQDLLEMPVSQDDLKRKSPDGTPRPDCAEKDCVSPAVSRGPDPLCYTCDMFWALQNRISGEVLARADFVRPLSTSPRTTHIPRPRFFGMSSEFSKYGPVGNLIATEVEHPGKPSGFDLLVKVKACSVNPVDTKVRAGVYDDYPDYYERTPALPQIIGFDGAGLVEATGNDVQGFKKWDEVYYSGSPVRHGSNAEYQLVDSRSVAHKPKSLTMVEAAAMPLTWITAYEALVERMEIKQGEDAGILIINGSGGIGSVASQIARTILKLPVVITTTSREETTKFSKEMGATHTVNHREDIVKQIKDLKLDSPIKYVFITHTPADKYIVDSAAICAPFGKVCSIVQTQEIPMYETEFMAKSLTFIWELLGTKPYYQVQMDSHGHILRQLTRWIDNGRIKCHLKQTLPLTLEGVRKGHELLEASGAMGKVGLSVDAEGSSEEQGFT
ncbi:hypothetical protein LTR94_013011 [Friedmanniomyces endolithicus]|nr:hypothetical protein LTR94_013011 [Friedmanniomyces endolithicus]KAK0831333.1 hypothetical protein LTR03_015483 [Friedmanniomyces endolithicus]